MAAAGIWTRVSRLALTAAAATATGAGAQETGDAPPPEPALQADVEGSATFLPADFTRFAPRNALDMLRNVPGFTIREATQERGLGTATGNVLINGQRISGKSNDVLTELGRIPASNVVRIEIRDAATLDVPGLSGQVANVVVKADAFSGQFAWRPEFRQRFTDPLLSRGEVSASGKLGRFDYNLGLQNNSFRAGAGGRTNIYAADGAFIERRNDVWTGSGEDVRASARITWDGPGSSVANLNASLRGYFYDYRELGTRTGPGLIDRVRRVTNDEDEWIWENRGRLRPRAGRRQAQADRPRPLGPRSVRAGGPDRIRQWRSGHGQPLSQRRRYPGADRPGRISLEMGQGRLADLGGRGVQQPRQRHRACRAAARRKLH